MLLLLDPAELTSHLEKVVALIHSKVIHLEGSPDCPTNVSNSVIGPFQGRISQILSIHVVVNHVIGCVSRVVLLHVREGFPCVFIIVPENF